MDSVNVTGAWSFNLKGKDPEQIKLYLVQNDSMVKGQGVINRKNETENATASGSITVDKMNLDVMSVGASNLYRLNLSLSSLAKGYYTAYLADGSNSQVRSHSLFPQISSRMHLWSMKRCQAHKRPKTQQSLNLPGFRVFRGRAKHWLYHIRKHVLDQLIDERRVIYLCRSPMIPQSGAAYEVELITGIKLA